MLKQDLYIDFNYVTVLRQDWTMTQEITRLQTTLGTGQVGTRL